MNESATALDLTYGRLEVDGFKVAGAPNYGIVSFGGEMVLKNGEVGVCGSSGIYIKDGKATLHTVDVKGVKGDTALPGIQVGHVDVPTAVVTMTKVNVTGAYRGITNRGTLTYNSGTISGNHNSGQLQSGGGINNYKTLTINGGTITGNSSVQLGGGVFNQGTLIINGGVIKNNTSGTSGGGLANSKSGKVTMKACEITGNTAKNNAGGIYNGGAFTMKGGAVSQNRNGNLGGGVVNEGTFYLTGGAISENTSVRQGGGIFNTSAGTAELSGGAVSLNRSGSEKGGGGVYNTGKLTVSGAVQIANNSAAGGGGAILNGVASSSARGSVTVSGGEITGNAAATSGGAVVNSADMTITGGSFTNNTAVNSGGAIYADETSKLTVSGGSFAGNTAEKTGGGIVNEGTFYLTGGTVSKNISGLQGGGLFNTSTGTAELSGGTVTLNESGGEMGGGGIYNTGKLTVSGTVRITQNSAAGGGGAILNGVASSGARGSVTVTGGEISANKAATSGGAVVNNADMTVTGGLFTGNTAVNSGGAVYSSEDTTLTVSGGSFTNNTAEKTGGGIFNQGTMELGGAVVENNRAGTTGGGVYNAKAGQAVMDLCNIAGNTSGGNAGGVYNGGAFTMKDGSVSQNKNGNLGGGMVNEGTFRMTGGTISKNVSALQGGGLFNASTGTAELSGGTVTLNESGGESGGGGIYNTGKLTVSDTVQITRNSAGGGGGAILNSASSSGTRGSVTVTGGKISGNTAGTSGGAVANNADMTVTGGRFEGNEAENNGGAVYSGEDAKLTVSGGRFTNNTAEKSGGGIYNQGTLTLKGGEITDNTAGTSGGGLANSKSGKVTMKLCEIKSNMAGNNAGGVYNGGTFTMEDGRITSNKNGNIGGGAANEGTFRMTGGVISKNISALQGGGLFNASAGTAELSGGTVTLNESGGGKGGGAVYNTGKLTVSDTVQITRNTAEGAGGAILNSTSSSGAKGSVTITGGEISGNTAASSGGAVSNSARLTIRGGVIKNNTAPNYGGAIYSDESSELTVSGGAFTKNTAGKSGGAMYVMTKAAISNVSLSGNEATENGGGLYLTSTADASLLGCTFSGNRAGKNGPEVFLYKGKATLNGGSFLNDDKPAVYNEQGTIALNGKVEAGIRTASALELLSSFSPESKITLTLSTKSPGTEVLKGSAEVIAASYGAFTILDLVDEVVLGDSGILTGKDSKREAVLCGADGTETAYSGSLAEVVGAAKDGQIVKLVDDAELSSTLAIGKKTIMIKDDGTPRTIKINHTTGRGIGLTSGANVTFEGTAAGSLTIQGPDEQTGFIGIHVNGSDLTMRNVVVKGFDSTNAGDTNGAALYCYADSCNVVLENTAFTGNKQEPGKTAGASVYVNAAHLTVDGGTIDTDGNGKPAIHMYNGTITLKGKPTLDVNLATLVSVELGESFAADSQVKLRLGSTQYKAGTAVLSGDAAAIKASYDKAFTLSNVPDGTVLDEDGKLAAAETPGPGPGPEPTAAEAKLYAADGTTVVQTGTFADMVNAATDGQIVELVDDAALSDNLTINKKTITIRDDGTPRTIKINHTKKRGIGLTSGANVTFEGTAADRLTIQGPDGQTGFIGIHVNGSDLTMRNVIVKSFDCTNAASNANGAALYCYADSCNVVLENTTFTGNKLANGVGASVYVNAAHLTIDGGSIVTVEEGKSPIHVYKGTITLKGKPTVDVKLGANISVALGENFAADSKVNLELAGYDVGTVVLSGDAEAIKASYDKAFTLLKAPEGIVLDETGKLAAAETPGPGPDTPPDPEAELYETTETGEDMIASGDFTEMVADAADGQIVVLKKDVALSSTLSIKNKTITIRDDGTPRTIKINHTAGRGIEITGGANVTFEGTENAPLTIQGPEKQSDSRGIQVTGSSLTMRNVVVRDFDYANSATTGDKTGRAALYCYAASTASCNVVLENTAFTGNKQGTSNTTGATAYVNNAHLTINGGNIVTVEGENPPVYVVKGTITLEGKPTVDVKLAKGISVALGENFAADSKVNLELAGYNVGTVVLSGDAEAIKASYDKAFTLPNAPEGIVLGEDGCLAEAEEESPEEPPEEETDNQPGGGTEENSEGSEENSEGTEENSERLTPPDAEVPPQQDENAVSAETVPPEKKKESEDEEEDESGGGLEENESADEDEEAEGSGREDEEADPEDSDSDQL